MKVYVLGYKGMLGRYVYNHFKNMGYDVQGFGRETFDAADMNESELTAALFHKGFQGDDVVINCIGTIKPQVDKLGTLNAIKVNSLFPHILANACQYWGINLIHITTDCVFSGNEGNYNEGSVHDCTDVYGKSKSLGEPQNCTVVRTSIIGEEVGQGRSLIEWVKSQEGKTINGYITHFWNGLTCHQVAKVFENIVRNNRYWKGVRHIHSNTVSKYELVKAIIDAHDLNIEVLPVTAPHCDRTMCSIYDFSMFEIPDIQAQLTEQYYNPPNFLENNI